MLLMISLVGSFSLFLFNNQKIYAAEISQLTTDQVTTDQETTVENIDSPEIEQIDEKSITVKITNLNHQIIKDAVVTLHLNFGQTISQRTDQEGRVTFSDIKPGIYALTIKHAGITSQAKLEIVKKGAKLVDPTKLTLPTTAVAVALPTLSILSIISSIGGNFNPGLLIKILQAAGLIPAGKPQGLIYDSQTYKSIPFALLTFRNAAEKNKENFIETAVSNDQGVYQGVKLLPGRYTLEVSQHDYLFPSQEKRPPYVNMRDFYLGEEFGVKNSRNKEFFLIPMDPIAKPGAVSIKKMFYISSIQFNSLTKLLFYPFYLATIVLLYTSFNYWNLLLFIIYTFIFLKKIYPQFIPADIEGQVYTIARNGIKDAIVRLREIGNYELKDIARTDAQGKFKLKGKGLYQYEASKLGWISSDTSMSLKEINSSQKKQKIYISMRKVSH